MTNNKIRNNDMVSESFFAFALKGIRTSTRVPKARLVWRGHSEFDLKTVARACTRVDIRFPAAEGWVLDLVTE